MLFSDNITDRMLGSPALLERMCRNLWVERGKVSEDGLVSVDTTSCTGLCDQGPALLVNGRRHHAPHRARASTRSCDLVRSEVPLDAWPAEFFRVEDNVHRRDVMLGTSWVRRAPRSTAALARGAEALVEEMKASRLRGRGGAGFATGAQVGGLPRRARQGALRRLQRRRGRAGQLQGPRAPRHRTPTRVLEGMTLCAFVVGRVARLPLPARRVPLPARAPRGGARAPARRGLLGESILGREGFDFDIDIHVGAGAYVCGEESALIESLEGKRGTPRNRPPYPVTHGYLGEPTVVNNVETLRPPASSPSRAARGTPAIGTPKSAGTKLLCVSGDCERPGIYEYPFGVEVRRGARRLRRAAHAGGAGQRARRAPASPAAEFDRRIAFEDLPTAGAFMVFDEQPRHVRGGAQLRALLRARELRLLHAVPRGDVAPRRT